MCALRRWSSATVLVAVFLQHLVLALEPRPKVKGSGTTITIEAGSTLQLECQVENMPRRLKAKWERCKRFNTAGACTAYTGLSSRNKAKYDRHYGLRKDGSEIYILHVYDIEPSQAGTYFCTVKTSLLSGRTQDYIHVVVYQKPVIDSLLTSSDLVAREGDSVRLDCTAYGSPEPLVMWQRAGGAVLPGGSFTRLNKSVEISSCDHRSKGTYICAASNAYGKTLRSITVDCLGSPTIHPAQSVTHQVVGYQAKLVCTIESSPAVSNIWWTKNGEAIQASDPRYSIRSMQAALGRVHTKLVLSKGVILSDYTSLYSCHAQNSFGVTQANISVAECETPQLMEGRLLSANTAVRSGYHSFYSLTMPVLVLVALSVS